MIDQFTREQFEDYLSSNHSPFQCLGLVQGEEAYLLPLDKQVSIMIRSSVKQNGISAGTSKDSIRVWLISGNRPLGSKISKWTNRTPGWGKRISEKIKQLTMWRALSGDCKECKKAKGIFISRTEQNKDRPFARCKDHKNSFQWLDEPIHIKDIYFSDLSKGAIDESAEIDTSGNTDNNSELEILAQSEPKTEGRNSLRAWASVVEDRFTNEPGRNTISVSEVSGSKEPNKAQREAIEADVNSNVRVLAGPGSGKTFVIEWRYKCLIENGVKPQNILVCTFNKSMADEMANRIKKTCPSAEIEQICTIHAFCSRLLTKWDESSKYFKWYVPYDWKVKSELENLIDKVWQGEKPSAKEVLDKVNKSKELGLTTEEGWEWFTENLGSMYGNWLYKIRASFDAWLARNKFLTFADMLYLVEQRLKTDDVWRTGLQNKFSHVIVDEAQDTNYQAMRILVTISLEPGQNTVYGEG